MYLYVHCIIIQGGQDMETEVLDREDVIHVYTMEYYPHIKKIKYCYL